LPLRAAPGASRPDFHPDPRPAPDVSKHRTRTAAPCRHSRGSARLNGPSLLRTLLVLSACATLVLWLVRDGRTSVDARSRLAGGLKRRLSGRAACTGPRTWLTPDHAVACSPLQMAQCNVLARRASVFGGAAIDLTMWRAARAVPPSSQPADISPFLPWPPYVPLHVTLLAHLATFTFVQ
jgi:hypothetical protein